MLGLVVWVMRAALASVVVVAGGAAARDGAAPDLDSRVRDYSVEYTLKDDATAQEVRRISVQVLKERALSRVKEYAMSFSTSIQKAEVIEAYTEKPGGRRVPAPKANFQVEANSGQGEAAPAFSDWTTMTVVFPDVEVGDTVTVAYRISATAPLFPGQFSAIERFGRTMAFDRVRVRLDAPAGLWLQHRANGMTESIQEGGGRRILEWTMTQPDPVKSRRFDYSAYDAESEPGVSISTFRSHRAIAEAYGVEARRKAIPDERARKLAADLAGTLTEPRAVAQALYEWVATNITYAGNCIGLGAVVPRNLDVVLDNRMGDCKDHATLLQALLSARGIESTQALVNSGSVYRLPAIPVVSMVNHVINYIPSLDLYLDSTGRGTPFGMLPFRVTGKPALLVDGYREDAKTPTDKVGSNRQIMKTKVVIAKDGSAKVEARVELEGRYAADARERMRYLRSETEETLVQNVLKGMGVTGNGHFTKDDPTALATRYRYGISFDAAGLFQYPGAGAFPLQSYLFSDAPVWHYIAGALQGDEEAPEWACGNGQSVEEYTYVLPKGMKVVSLPGRAHFANALMTYEATYSRNGNVITARRAVDDRTPGGVCDRRVAEAYIDVAKRALPNLKAQVVYR